MKILQKWKIILANWINCYSEEDTNKKYSVTSKSLVNIISHLRENLNLDESTSSTLDAQSIQEFILEKYPDFRFENGNLEPKNEEEIYLAASLLLYFVCVNSKDLDIKKAMCYELSAADQEIILKFSKSLMDCTDISSTDVLTAIAEACGQDAATANIGPTMVAETPPALRSLHGEVRRLQAALDAERFDRNYLQEELSRTNLKIEKLLKDKEQYKQDIVNLKAKLCSCGQDTSTQDVEASNNNSVKLVKQLDQMENRLITVQETLDEVKYERDMYKNKLDELKRERDKLIASSHEETSRACRLEDELEIERKNVQSLRELVTELRQHNRLNGVDTSQLECDDLDASVRSLHNASVCSEACANVIEVQLGEERAKIVLLEQQIKLLQNQLDDVMRKSEEETHNLSKIISEKDTDIFNLKHRINEEIEEKNNLKLRYEDDVTRLNNEVNELEQRIRGNGENSRRIIDSKMKEIQILQEEKLSLLQSMSDESAKLGKIIQKLTTDLDAEKTSKLKIKEDYENKVMKLNEKVLNRNNELVELQNKISENGEAIEKLQFDLRKENELRGELINKYNSDVTNLKMQIQAYEDHLRQRNDEIANLKEQIHECNACNEQLEKERENLRSCIAKCKNDISILEDCKAQLLISLQNRDSQIKSLQNEKEHIENEYTKERERLKYNLDEINATVETLRNQLQNEIQYKIGIQNELHKCELSNQNSAETINNLNEQISTFKNNFEDKEHALLVERKVVAELKEFCKELDAQVQELNKNKTEKEITIQELTKTVNNLNEQLTETKQILVRETEVIAELKKTCDDLNIKVEEMDKIITEKEMLINVIKESLDKAKIKFDEECGEKNKVIDILNNNLTSKTNSLHDLEKRFSVLHMEKDDLEKHVKDMNNLNINLKNEISKLSQKVKEHESTIDKLKQIIGEKTKANDIIQKKYDAEIVTLMSKINVSDKLLKDLQTKSNNLIQDKELEVETLKIDIEKLQILLQQECEKSFSIEKEKMVLLQHMNEANTYKNICEKEYLNKCALLNSVSAELNEEILKKDAEICELKNKLEHLEKCNEDSINEIKTMKNNLNQAIQSTKDITLIKDKEIENLLGKIKHLEILVLQSEKELKAVIDSNKQVVEVLQKDNVQLHYTIEEDNSTHELLIKEKDVIIEGLETRLKNVANSLNLIQKEYEADKFVWEKLKSEMQEEINEKLVAITELTNKVTSAGVKMRNLETLNNILIQEKDDLTAQVDSLRHTYTESAHTCDSLKESLLEQTALRHALEIEKQNLITEKENMLQRIDAQEVAYRNISAEKDSLLNEKAILVQELMEEKSIRKIADEGKGALYVEKQQIDNKLREVEDVKNNLLQEKECLTQQLVEERLAKDLAEQEKKNIIDAKVKLEEELSAQTVLRAEVERKNVSLIQEIQNLGKEYAMLTKENSSLNTEKEELAQSYTELKSTFDKMTLEKTEVLEQISNFKKSMETELTSKLEQVQNLVLKCNQLNADYCALKEDEQKLCTILNDGLSKVFKNTNKDTTCKDILSKYDDASASEKCDVVFKIINNLVTELTMKNNLEQEALQKERMVVKELSEMVEQKNTLVTRLQDEVHTLEKAVTDYEAELMKAKESHNGLLEMKAKEIHHLQLENQTLRNELNDVKIQMDVRVHSLKEKLIDNENVTDKLKCQIDNLNTMITKLTNYLKEKTTEIEALRNEKERLQNVLEDNNASIKSLEEELKTEKHNKEKLISDFESERLVLKNMVTVTESVMEDQKVCLNKIITDHVKSNQNLEEELKNLKPTVETERQDAEIKLQDKGEAFKTVFKELTDMRKEKEILEKEFNSEKESFEKEVTKLIEEISEKTSKIDTLTAENKEIRDKLIEQTEALEELNSEWKIKNDTMEAEFCDKVKMLQDDFDAQRKRTSEIELLLKKKETENEELFQTMNKLKIEIENLNQEKSIIEKEKSNICQTIVELKEALAERSNDNDVLLTQSKNEITELKTVNEDMKTRIIYLEECLQSERQKLEENANEKINITNKCSILEEYQMKAEIELEERQKEIHTLQDEVKALKSKMEQGVSERDGIIEMLKKEKDAIIKKFNKELIDEKERLELKDSEIQALRKKLDEIKNNEETINILKSENENLIKALRQRETIAVASLESPNIQQPRQIEHRDLQQQVDTTSTDYSSMESSKTITDLEKIIQDRNRTITTLQSDITYLKSLVAESENKYLDVAKDLEMSKENCHQLSSQLKKIVHQKNEEIADLKKQVTKMSVTENRASQIIKVSAKYQAIILKRIAEIKSNTVLKELTNFGNTNCDTDLRKSLTAGTITMEDLENFLETTERHIRRCSEKQIALQKDRDRLAEINRINESEIINIRKFLTELSVSIKTFNSVKELYTQKLSKVVSLQRTVRREILSLDGRLTDAAMNNLERGYSAVMQDLYECAMNLERWIERCVSRTISSEKIKQAFSTDDERASLSSASFQNTGLEVQLEELQNSFQKLLEEIARAQKGEGAKDVQSVTVMEVRAEYEDKLNRMKAKMKQLYQEQITIFKEKQHEEIIRLESELKKTQTKLHECEEHIKSLTTELWTVGEKYLMKKDEADWLRKKQRSGSLMSLQHVHSSGLVPPVEERGRPSDTHSLRSLPANNNNNNNNNKEGRGLHMSDEEGEVFDNRWLRELATTPRRDGDAPPGQRLSELRYRNSLCPPHLKSSYPAETQFAPAIHEEDIKCSGSMSLGGKQRKEVGITAYKKPGPPTPSKQAGRLSATDSELRESLRIEADPSASRKTSTPSRIRSLFRSNKNDTIEGTPRSRRLSNIFRKK